MRRFLYTTALVTLFAACIIRAQQAGTATTETHPPLTISNCTASGCTTSTHAITLDANWRWLHTTTGYTNCYTGTTWDATLCPDPTTCAANCALDGADYSGTYGITTSGSSATLKFVTGSNVGSRNFLMAANGVQQYEKFKLKNREFTFDVDVSALPCGLNGALYLVEMDADGGLSEYSGNKAGAKYGTGYCDTQCPQDIKFINGQANILNWNQTSATGSHGSCCNEMDLWEANSVSNALTPHVCSTSGQTVCTDAVTCGAGANRQLGTCDKDGCDFNPYRLGNTTFYGPSPDKVNTAKVFSVVTQFITSDGTDAGTLSEIRRFYVQNGVTIKNSYTNIKSITSVNSITDTFCNQQKSVFGDANTFEAKGGLAAMGKSLDRGMVLVLSLWDDHAANMLWLDAPYPPTKSASALGVTRGTCGAGSGVPATVESASPGASVTFSNIKVGVLGSTFKST